MKLNLNDVYKIIWERIVKQSHIWLEFYEMMYVKFSSRISMYLPWTIHIKLYSQIMCFPKDVPIVHYIPTNWLWFIDSFDCTRKIHKQCILQRYKFSLSELRKIDTDPILMEFMVHLLLNIGAASSLEKNNFVRNIFTHVSWYIFKNVSLVSLLLLCLFPTLPSKAKKLSKVPIYSQS